MKRSTIAVITVTTLIVFHGAHLLFGWVGIASVFVAVAVFLVVAWALYWRQLRKLRQATRWLPEEDQKLVYSIARFDAEARRDMKALEDRERKVFRGEFKT